MRGALLLSLLFVTGCNVSSTPSQDAVAPQPAPTTLRTLNAADGFNYLLPSSFAKTLTPALEVPAPPTSPQMLAIDYDYNLERQRTRTAAECSRAKDEADPSVNVFFGPQYGPLADYEITRWSAFLEKVMDDGDRVANLAKPYWNRPRPPVDHRDLQPCTYLPGSPSYPSGHSTDSHLLALVLSNLDPRRAAEFEARADQIADDRVMAGVHYLSDIEAGKTLAREIFREMLKNPDFTAELDRLAIKK